MANLLPGNYACLDVVECGSSDARRKYDDGSSFCFSCKKPFKPEDSSESNEEPVRPRANVRIRKEPAVTLEDIEDFQIKGFRNRDITKKVCEFFKVKVSYGSDGQIDTHYYPYENGAAYKVRKLPKEFTWVGTSKALFGQEHFNGENKRLIICEGEIDAMSVAQASLDRYGKIFPVVALSSSVMTKSLLENRTWIRSFGEVVIMFDHDDAGEKAKKDAIKIIGVDKVKLAKLPENDVNLTLTEHGSEAVMQAVFNAARYVPAGIVGKEELWTALETYNSLESTPYPACLEGLNTKLKGMRNGEITLFISGTGCHGYDETVLMFDGSIKTVQDVKVGDLLMGPDNLPRTVKQLHRGREQMVKQILRDGTESIFNISHILSVVNNDNEGRWGLKKDEIVDVSIADYLAWSPKRKHLSKAFKVEMLDFGAQQLSIHPYLLGAWLGDGEAAGGRIYIQDSDSVIIEKLNEIGGNFTKSSNLKFAWNSPGGFRLSLKDLNLLKNKHIPEQYLKSSIEDRLELLAGLLDTDGNYDSSRHTFEFSQKDHAFTLQVKRLAESLGFTCTLGKQVNNKFGNCYRLYITGELLETIPTVLPRKQARVRQQKKDPHRYSFTLELLDVDEYYGFEVDADHRYVMGNFMVTHNSGKSTMLREIILHLLESTDEKIGIVSLEESPAETARKLAGMALNRNPANEEIPLDELKVGFDKIFGDDRVIVLDHQGAINDNSIIEQLEYMCLAGCSKLFVDHITILVSEGVDKLTGNEAQDKVMNDLLRLVKRHPVWIGLVSHLRKAQSGGKSFEEGKLPSIDDIRGSGSIKQISFDIIAFARNLTASNDKERNTILMQVLKSRYTGLTGQVQGACYDYLTGRLNKSTDSIGDDEFEIL